MLQLNQKTFYSVNVNKLNKLLNEFEWNASIIGEGGMNKYTITLTFLLDKILSTFLSILEKKLHENQLNTIFITYRGRDMKIRNCENAPPTPLFNTTISPLKTFKRYFSPLNYLVV